MKFISAIVASIAVGCLSTAALSQSTAVQWTTESGGNGHWYGFSVQPLEWQAAQQFAALRGAHLVTYSSSNEQDFVWSAFTAEISPNPFFIGCFQEPDSCEPGCGWRWVTDEPFDYSRWSPSEPNDNRVSGNEDAVCINGGNLWNDLASQLPIAFAYEWSADCNSDGIVDYGQILSGALADANGNNVPDCCESQSWATVLEYAPNPAVVTDLNLRAAISAAGLPWRVVDNGTGIEMLLVPGGTFMMGCSPGDTECIVVDETPVHQVTLTQAFYLGKTEVTQGQYGGGTSTLPRNLSWNNAQAFCTAKGLRLPTSAEWEFACRAGTTTARYGVSNDIAWYNTNSGGVLHSVATKLPNAFGLYDMLGNLNEFCSGWWDTYTQESVIDPQGPTSGTYHVLRGGSFLDTLANNRASTRGGANSTQTELHLGFRVAKSAVVMDSDGDGIPDSTDTCPTIAGSPTCNGCPLNVCGECGTATDTDSDGTANCIDDDDDNDGVVDSADAFPLDASESVDSDGDGVGNNADQDDDGDGADDATDGCPLDANKSAPGQCGCGIADTDTDGDGIANCVDNCVAISNPTQADCNGDGIGDACESAAATAITAKLWGAAGGPSKCCYGGISCGSTGVAGGYVNTSLDNITLDFPTFSGHTIILTNSPGRLELFGAEITK